MRVGAIDCGTNSIRLLIADVKKASSEGEPPVVTDVVREMRVVRLGAGVDATGWLAQDSLDRTFAAAEEYARLIEKHKVKHVRMVATSATRDAGNRHAFVEGINQRLGVVPEVISGSEEAELSFRGAAATIGPVGEGRDLVVDVGGGSTEFVLGDASGVLASRSVNIGCVRLTERHLSSNPPTDGQVRMLLGDVDVAVTSVLEAVPVRTTTRLVGVAGSVTTLTAYALGLSEYDAERIHGSELSIDAVSSAAEALTRMTRAERADLGIMHEGRADVIGAGAQIWARIAERVAEITDGAVTTCLASEHDILDGIALSVAEARKRT
ncbi:exopolyphosphatase [Kocuria koreensis]|jgi:exopolyphosphatase/guanosine-5'-triphosphate,3'-diphosphate pyrophosphatase|uniref:Exopolyphosphatase n=1 Tax=Rothia koreensis TaxID=592378 RepID=A0A7K1LIC9_9MICC|nr:Ppx/GppA phosphatase family protein [Rothia koreensis]MUN54926.1 exopolyphosphatase [Rothia koreensis]